MVHEYIGKVNCHWCAHRSSLYLQEETSSELHDVRLQNGCDELFDQVGWHSRVLAIVQCLAARLLHLPFGQFTI